MSTASSIFTGASRYSSDFQAVIERSVGIASLPLMQMQTARSNASAQSTAVNALANPFIALRSAVSGLVNVAGSSSYQANVSDSKTLRATIAEGATTGNYKVEVTDLGSPAAALSSGTGIDDPARSNIGSSGNFTLQIYSSGSPQTLLSSDHFQAGTLDELVQQINASDLDVEATLVNVQGSGSPVYKLSLQSTKLGPLEFRLSDDAQPATNLLGATQAGALAQYTVNGSAVVKSDSRTATLAPGVTIELLQEADGSPVTVSVSRSTAAFKSAVSKLASAYNSALDALDKNRGEKGGALTGNSIISDLQQSLRAIANYGDGTGYYTALAEVGIELKDNGQLSFNETDFDQNINTHFAELGELLGDGESGFIKSASAILDGLVGENGLIEMQSQALADSIQQQDDRMATEQERIDQLREDITARINAADALIASLEQQVLYITNMFSSMKSISEQM